MLASKMQLKLPYILQGFLDSEMEDTISQNGQIFLQKHSKDDFLLMENSIQGKPNQKSINVNSMKFLIFWNFVRL